MIATDATEEVASGFLAKIEAVFKQVRQFPLAASRREQFGVGLRVVFQRPYAIYYRPLADAIVIVRVLHGARDAAAIAEREGFGG